MESELVEFVLPIKRYARLRLGGLGLLECCKREFTGDGREVVKELFQGAS